MKPARGALCTVAWLLVSCRLLHPDQEADLAAAPLQQADAAWLDRANGGLEPVTTALDALLAQAPTDGRVLWRVARLRWLQGYLDEAPAAARNDWETGREYALSCLVVDPDVAASLRQAAWRVNDAALLTTTPEQRPCLLWAAANSLALLEQRGSGALLDADAACAMAERARALVGPAEPGLVEWERGTCAWWRSDDAAAATEAWEAALREGANPLYALAPRTHVPDAALDFTTKPEFALERARVDALLGSPSP